MHDMYLFLFSVYFVFEPWRKFLLWSKGNGNDWSETYFFRLVVALKP